LAVRRKAFWNTVGRGVDAVAPAFFLVCAIAAVLGGLYYGLFYLSKPTVYANPGLTAYRAPPATQLVPLPRVSDAPQIVDEPTPNVQPGAAFAQAPASPADTSPPSHERKGTRTLHDDDPRADAQAWSSFGYARQGDASYHDPYRASGYGGSSYAAPARAPMRGGPKSPL
jgi:hypothetical protein